MPFSVISAVAAVAGVAVSAEAASDQEDAEQQSLEQQKSVEQQQLDLETQQQNNSNTEFNRYMNVEVPLQDQEINEARDYGSNANRERAAAQAGGDVTSSYAALQQQLNSTPGLDPSSAKYLDTESRLGVQEAGAKAAAETGARTTTDQIAAAKLNDATALGQGLPATSEAALAGASSSANSAGNTAYGEGRNALSGEQLADGQLASSWKGLGQAAGTSSFQNTIGGFFNGDTASLNPSASALGYGMGSFDDGSGLGGTVSASFGGGMADV